MTGRRHECCKHGSGGTLLWLSLPLVFIVLKTDFLPQVVPFSRPDFTNFANKMADKVSSLGMDSAGRQQQQQPLDVPKSESAEDHTQQNGPKDSSLVNSDVTPPATSKLLCNFSNDHSNFCEMEGDVRIHGKSGMIYVVSSSTYKKENSTILIRPYTRKWEEETMSRIRELGIRSSPSPGAAADDDDIIIVPPRCTAASHDDVPAVVFSTGGFCTNFFHAMSDLIIPLYVTAREYGGRVQLLAANHDAPWFAKFGKIVAALSFYPVVNLDADDAVRCFPAARVGLESHRMLGIDPARARNGLNMAGFREFLFSVYSLPTTPVSRRRRSSGGEQIRRPRLLMLLRRNWRSLTNEDDVIAALKALGFEVVTAAPEDMGDLARFAPVVNSCDVLLGVHGAGLTSMVFLPDNGTIVQIIPWGELKWACRYDYGEPVPDMGLRYVEYEITAEETTLKDKYPRDHPVFTDPISMHGNGGIFKYFIRAQNVTLDIPRFIRETMRPLYESITTE